MKIVVLCGGLSVERNVSLSSGSLICRSLRKSGHQAVLVDMFFGLEDCPYAPEELFDRLLPIEDATVAAEAPDLEAIWAMRKWKSPSLIGKGVLELCQLADVVFLGLHGTCGEDGRIQAALDLLGVKYTGSGYLGSALAMDKDLTKKLIENSGVKTPNWKLVQYTKAEISDICAEAALPCVVKPVDSGSSVGVSIARTESELRIALETNVHLGRVMLEDYIAGREIDVGVLEGRTLPPIEIIPKEGFYDYRNKYQPGATVEICPAQIDPEAERKLRNAALTVHKCLRLKAYSRSDFILDEKGDAYFLEINTLPGMTPTSLIPQEAAADGISYDELCQRLIDVVFQEASE